MVELVIEHFGSNLALAKRLGVKPEAVSQWKTKGIIPPYRALQIEMITDGKFKALDLVEGLANDSE